MKSFTYIFYQRRVRNRKNTNKSTWDFLYVALVLRKGVRIYKKFHRSYANIYMYNICVYTHTYGYVEREREREKGEGRVNVVCRARLLTALSCLLPCGWRSREREEENKKRRDLPRAVVLALATRPTSRLLARAQCTRFFLRLSLFPRLTYRIAPLQLTCARVHCRLHSYGRLFDMFRILFLLLFSVLRYL